MRAEEAEERLDPGRAGGAGHAADYEAHLGRIRRHVGSGLTAATSATSSDLGQRYSCGLGFIAMRLPVGYWRDAKLKPGWT